MDWDQAGELLQIAAVLSLPFLAGIALGVEIVRRRPKSTSERFGDLITNHIAGLHDKAQFLPEGSGTIVSYTLTVPSFRGRETVIELRVAA